jgi:cell wall-associated NlpC family hydrolase
VAGPLLTLLGLFLGALCTGAVILGGMAGSLSLGDPGPAPAPGRTATAPGAPAVSPSAQAAAEAAAAACPGLDWTLLAAGVLVDPALSAGLDGAAATLCQDTDRTAGLVALLPGPTEGEVALVLSHALDADPALNGMVATVLTFAAANLGAPYRWGGTGPGGFDCSGLTLEAYRAAGVSLPRVAQDQYDAGPPVPAGAPLLPGDLIFFGSGPEGVSHVGIYIGGGDMIDAPHTGAFVRVEPTPVVPGAPFGDDVVVGATRPWDTQ